MIYAPGVVTPRVAAFVGLILLARVLPPVEFGLYSLTILIGEACDGVFINWVRLTHMRLDHGRNSDPAILQLNRRLFWITLIPAGLAALAAGAAMAPEHCGPLALATTAYLLANGHLKNVLTSLRTSSRSVAFAALEGSRSVALIGVLFGLLGWGADSFLPYSLAASAVTILAASFVRPADAANSGATPIDLRQRFALGAPLVALAAVATVASTADRTVLETLTDTSTFGIYALIYALGRQPVDLVGYAVNASAFPELIRRHERHGGAAGARYLRQVALLLMILMVVCAAIVTVMAGWLLPKLLPAVGPAAPAVIAIVAMASVLTNLKAFASDQVFHATNQNWKQMLSLLPAVAAAIAASLLLVPGLGVVGASLGYLAGAVAGLVMSVLLGRNYFTQPTTSQ